MRQKDQRLQKFAFIFVSMGIVVILSNCATKQTVLLPDQIIAPIPIQGNSGKYMCPYTSDGVLAEWVDKAINARIGATVGETVGTYTGQKVLKQVPFVGGFLGEKAGKAVGRQLAIKASGGWEYIKETSDLSFNSCDDLAVYLYAKYSRHAHYQDALKAIYEIYPELQKRYWPAIRKAPRKQ